MKTPTVVNGEPVPFSASVPELVSRLRPPGAGAWAAFAALGSNPTDDALGVLLQFCGDPDWRYRRVAIEALALHALGRSAALMVCQALGDRSPYVVRTACEAAASLGLAEAHAPVRRLLLSESGETREAAAAAIARLWLPEDFEPVMRLFREDPLKGVRRQAAWALATNASSATWRELVSTWRNDSLPRHRIWACELVERFGDEEARAGLGGLLTDANGHVRKAAQRAASPEAAT